MNATFSVLRNANFARYFTAQFLSSIGNGMQFIAMSWLLYQLTGSVAAMGYLLVITALPNILLGPWIGVLIDRWNVKKICIAMDLVRGAVFIALAAAFFAGKVTATLIYATELLIVCSNSFYQPSAGILVRSVVGPQTMLSANVVRSMGAQVGILVGAAAGGLLIAAFSIGTVITINAVSFLCSALLTMQIKDIIVGSGSQARAAGKAMLGDFLDGARYMRRNTYLLALAWMLAAVYLTLYVCNTLLPAFVSQELRLGARGFGLIDASWAAGAIVAGLALPYLVRNTRPRQFMSSALVLLACAIGLFASASGLLQATLGYFLIGLLISAIRVNADTVIQMSVEAGYLGRVITTINMAVSWLSLLVYASVGYLGDLVPVRAIYFAIGGLIFCGAAVPFLFVNRAKDRELGAPHLELAEQCP